MCRFVCVYKVTEIKEIKLGSPITRNVDYGAKVKEKEKIIPE